jgi:hypothetical protein
MVLTAGLALAALADGVLAQNAPQAPAAAGGRRDPATSAAFAGRYRCIWTSPDGFVFECELQLRSGGTTDLEGRVQWTLERAGRPELAAKVGKSGAELVRGAVVSPGVAELKGYDKNDPENVRGLAEYRLELSGSARWLVGEVGAGSKLDSHFVAIRY